MLQVKIPIIDATEVTTVNASIMPLPAYSMTRLNSSITVVRYRALAGTPFLVSLPSAEGAAPSCARPYTMREVEKIPEFAEDAAEVSTTKFTREAAIPMPARENMPTKGLMDLSSLSQGVTARMVSSGIA